MDLLSWVTTKPTNSYPDSNVNEHNLKQYVRYLTMPVACCCSLSSDLSSEFPTVVPLRDVGELIAAFMKVLEKL